MSVELWKWIFDWATVLLAALTFVALAGALITGNKLSDRQAEQLRQFDENLTDAKTELGKQEERAAKAEESLLKLKAQAAPRMLTKAQFDDLRTLKGKIKVLTVITETDAEPYGFAMQISVALKEIGIDSLLYERAASAHSTAGITLYDPYAFDNPNGAPTKGEPLKSLLESGNWNVPALAIQSRLPVDVKAPSEIPAIMVCGKPPIADSVAPAYFGPPQK